MFYVIQGVIIDIFNNYLRLRSTTTPTGKLHGDISKCIYNMIFKVHLITAISSFNEHIYLNGKLYVFVFCAFLPCLN
jgi:hypothetical protein